MAVAQQPSTTLDAFVEAFNAHDAARMASLVTDQFQLFYVSKDGKVKLATTGPAALKAEMTQYFQGLPTVRSTIDQRNEVGDYISFRETATWTAKDGGLRTQSSLAVYQLNNGKIHRVWYYPAQ